MVKTNKRSLVFFGLLLVALPSAIIAKTTNGQFQLTNQKTEHVITAYSIAAGARGLMTAVLISEEEYSNESNLRMHLYRDDDWSQAQRETTCQEKTRLARQTVQVSFEPESPKEMAQWGRKKPHWRSETHVKIEPVDDDSSDYAPRHHYWYIVMDDCSLDNDSTNNKVPGVKYYVQIYNMLTEQYFSHLSTDEFLLSRTHTLTMFFSGILAFLLFGKISYHLTTYGIVHIAKFLVMGAAGLDATSSVLQLLHLNFYRFNGVGIQFLDAYSAYAEAMCDAVVSFLILAISAGWTLPSDVISVHTGQQNASLLQNIFIGLANPAGYQSAMNPFSGLLFGLISAHLVLAQWGLAYDDEYDSYHDLEHLPGKILMGVRSALGIMMLAAITHTRMKCNASLQSFYCKFAIVGTMWFQGLPVITWMCNTFVPFHQRHPTVVIAGAILQCTLLVLLSWLVAINSTSSYHKVSHITHSGDNNLTEKLSSLGSSVSEASTWRLFGRAKVRLD